MTLDEWFNKPMEPFEETRLTKVLKVYKEKFGNTVTVRRLDDDNLAERLEYCLEVNKPYNEVFPMVKGARY